MTRGVWLKRVKRVHEHKCRKPTTWFRQVGSVWMCNCEQAYDLKTYRGTKYWWYVQPGVRDRLLEERREKVR